MYEYKVIRSDRKTLSLQITVEGAIVVRAPKRLKDKDIARFVNEKNAWIEKHLSLLTPQEEITRFTEEELKALAKRATEYIPLRVAFFAVQMGVTVGRITIRNQRTRWGSCSAKGNLNFNCLLMCFSEDVIDYVVVHELAHRKEMNHSKSFWTEVEKYCPRYKTLRNSLKTEGAKLIGGIK